MSNDKMELNVRYHPSGRYTLMRRTGNEMHEDVLISDDKGDFYQQVAHELCKLHTQGVIFSFTDSASNSDTA